MPKDGSSKTKDAVPKPKLPKDKLQRSKTNSKDQSCQSQSYSSLERQRPEIGALWVLQCIGKSRPSWIKGWHVTSDGAMPPFSCSGTLKFSAPGMVSAQQKVHRRMVYSYYGWELKNLSSQMIYNGGNLSPSGYVDPGTVQQFMSGKFPEVLELVQADKGTLYLRGDRLVCDNTWHSGKSPTSDKVHTTTKPRDIPETTIIPLSFDNRALKQRLGYLGIDDQALTCVKP
ncbi:hypothetical protein C8F04DRAFT_1176864 [Mycena alexandri]|uniref:Uncharacterized protein n=1 Tax=Mycena alexandri TaxID=1745969 RepID=A0AAD6TA19_9AGAR|nr:hypothetical protein C8F04DRAFT_1176864 [Mycena alexandri]